MNVGIFRKIICFGFVFLILVYSFGQNPHKIENKLEKFSVNDSLRCSLIKFATQLVGTPYKYAGGTPERGFDCSGFVRYVFKSINIDLPHSSNQLSHLKGEIIPLNEAQPGDLIFFGRHDGKKWRTSHTGIIYEYADNEPLVIHCCSRGVIIDGNNTNWDGYWKQRILFVKRLPQFE